MRRRRLRLQKKRRNFAHRQSGAIGRRRRDFASSRVAAAAATAAVSGGPTRRPNIPRHVSVGARGQQRLPEEGLALRSTSSADRFTCELFRCRCRRASSAIYFSFPDRSAGFVKLFLRALTATPQVCSANFYLDALTNEPEITRARLLRSIVEIDYCIKIKRCKV